MNIVKAELRAGNAKVNALRREGFVPGCIYGAQLSEALSIKIPVNNAVQLLRRDDAGSKVGVELDGKKLVCLIKDVAKDSVNGQIKHISFHALEADRKVTSSAKIVLQNRELVAGFISQALFELPYTAFPADIVDTVYVNLENRPLGTRITVADLEIAGNENIELLLERDSVVLSISENSRA